MDQPFFIPEKNEIDNKINVAVYYALLIYIVSLFSEYIPVISNIMMALVFVASLVLAFQKGGSQLFYRNKALTGIILFFLIQFLSVLFSQNKKEGFTILSSVVPFFLFAVSFCFIEFKQSTWNRLLLFFAVITTLASVIGFGAGVYNSVTLHDNGYLYNDNICFVLGKQAVYFAFYVSIAILIYIYHLITNENKKSAAWIYLAICWLFIIIFLLASRTAMFGLLAILCIYLGTILIQRKKYMEICILFLSLAIGAVILIKLFPKTLNRFKGTTETSFQFDNQNTENHFNATFDKTKWNSSNTRAAIWTCAVEVWRMHPVLGTGLGDKTDELRKKYEEKRFWYALTTQKNTHNQYLDILMSMGLIGLFIFLICYFIFPLWIFRKERRIFAILIFLLLAICLFTENMFSRYQGIVLISFILPLASKIKNVSLSKPPLELVD